MKTESIAALNEHIEAMQAVMREYLSPDGKVRFAEDFANKIIEMLDGPKQREVQGAAKELLAYADKFTQSEGIQRAFSVHATTCGSAKCEAAHLSLKDEDDETFAICALGPEAVQMIVTASERARGLQ